MVETKFKQTDVGLIPEDWEVKSIGEIGEIRMCKRVMKYETSEIGEVPFYKIGTFGGFPDAYISYNLFREYRDKYSYPKKGDILVSAAGTIGRTVIFDGNPSYFQDSNIVWVENNEKIVTNKFLYYIYRTIDWNTSDTTIKRLYNDNFRGMRIPLPSLEEQERIASALTSIDNLISSLDKQIAKTRHIKRGAMRQLLTFPDNVPLRPLGDYLFYEQPAKYIVKSNDYYDAGIPVLTAGQSFILGYTKETEGMFNAGEDNPVIIFDDFTTSFHWVDFNFKVKSSAMKMLRPSSNRVSFKYVYYAMSRITYEPVEHSRQWISVYSKFTIPVPSIEEQQRIASTLTAMDNQIAALEAKRRKYEMLKQGMMQQLLTGKIRLSPE